MGKFFVVMLALMLCGNVYAVEMSDFSYLDRVLTGVAWGDETETYLSTNLCTYKGEAWDGKLAKVEPSIDFGVLNYQDLTFDSLDDLTDFLKENSIADVSVNIVKASEMLPVLEYVSSLIPEWVYVGAGGGLRYIDSDFEFEAKVTAAIKKNF